MRVTFILSTIKAVCITGMCHILIEHDGHASIILRSVLAWEGGTASSNAGHRYIPASIKSSVCYWRARSLLACIAAVYRAQMVCEHHHLE